MQKRSSLWQFPTAHDFHTIRTPYQQQHTAMQSQVCTHRMRILAGYGYINQKHEVQTVIN